MDPVSQLTHLPKYMRNFTCKFNRFFVKFQILETEFLVNY